GGAGGGRGGRGPGARCSTRTAFGDRGDKVASPTPPAILPSLLRAEDAGGLSHPQLLSASKMGLSLSPARSPSFPADHEVLSDAVLRGPGRSAARGSDDSTRPEVAYPSRLIYYLNEDTESTYRDLDTRTRHRPDGGKVVHLAQASFQLEAFGSRFILDLTLNNDLLSSNYVEIHYEDGKPVQSKGGEHCYYHGQVRGNKHSYVALSTCNEMKYLEIMIDADLPHFCCPSSLPASPQVFKEQLNTRVVLVAVEIWTDEDQIPISVTSASLKPKGNYSLKYPVLAGLFCRNVTFHYRWSSASYFGGVCSLSRGVGVNEFGSTWTMAAALSQSLAQNLGIQWDPATKRKCGCMESWFGCIMEDTGVQHPRKFSKCSISDYKEFLLKGGGSCLFNRPTKLFEATECGNGYVEVGEECDCGPRAECYKECCKKCSLSNGAHCSDGPCCNNTCLFYPRGYSCRYAVNDCDISETCSGDSGQCPPNLHKQDGYQCQLNQGRCYGGECKTRESQCKYIWGPKAGASEKFCYEKLNTEGSEKGNCGKDGETWLQCGKHDIFCGYLLCANIGHTPRIGFLKGDITSTSFNHQGRLVDCSGGHVLLDDETDLGYVEDGTPCGPSMMCLDRKCLPIQSFNMSACPTGSNGQVCSNHGVCNNEATCTCDATWAGTDCSMPDPPKEPPPTEDEGPKGPSATNLIIAKCRMHSLSLASPAFMLLEFELLLQKLHMLRTDKSKWKEHT
uniref:ADAM metallopeptidase domain 23a n=1 Tax=Scleropages formosus TaxID=113540 RepID=A0A8C9VLE4_SCLFO